MKNYMTSISTDEGKKAHNEFSKWTKLDEIYEAKRMYYKGNAKLTDSDYDNLEAGFKVLHGEHCFDEWYCVGYDKGKHDVIKKLQHYWDIKHCQMHVKRGILVTGLDKLIQRYVDKYGSFE